MDTKNSIAIKEKRNKAYDALFYYATELKNSGYAPVDRVKMIRDLAQEIAVQFV